MSGNSEMNALAASDAHPETMDFLSLAWCNFAVQALAPPPPPHHHLQLDPLPLHLASPTTKVTTSSMEKSPSRMDGPDFTSLPPWSSNNDVKSWLRMQQAMHPELNYNTSFRKKWMPWKEMVAPLKRVSIKKWFKEIKQKRKEEQRLQRAEVHAAVSIAGVAAALAAIAADNNNKKKDDDEEREAAIASAAALVASQCAKVAESMGANKLQLSNLIASAITSTSTTDILTFTAAASTSLKGAATLKARAGCNNNNRLHGGAPVLPIEDNINNNDGDLDYDFEKGKYILAQGAELYVESPEGKYMPRSVCVILDGRAKVVLIMRKHNLFKTKKESIVVNMHAEVYKGSSSEGEDSETCYLIALTTRGGGLFKLDMATDFRRYKTWATTINRMLNISTYHLQYC
ncbi:hypothetical protein PIB30_027517 [Stylosanthes scabra]|uniref:VAN3-binding protein n=1 Tax=Stylosanthes scabra TaxID=79078 RepID=A0ABU6SAW3_9FABA|nr:hypothetical protein [Stylosanthes scabra]